MVVILDDAAFFKATGTNIRIRRPYSGELREILRRSVPATSEMNALADGHGPGLVAPLEGFEWRVVVVRIAPGHHARMLCSQRVDAPELITARGPLAAIPIVFGDSLAIDQQR